MINGRRVADSWELIILIQTKLSKLLNGNALWMKNDLFLFQDNISNNFQRLSAEDEPLSACAFHQSWTIARSFNSKVHLPLEIRVSLIRYRKPHADEKKENTRHVLCDSTCTKSNLNNEWKCSLQLVVTVKRRMLCV